MKLVGCFIVLVSAGAQKGNGIFISFTAAEINGCKCIVFGLSSSVTSTITMFTVIYKCVFNIIHLGRLTNSAVAKVWPLFNSVVTMWIFISHVLGPGHFHARSS